MAPIVNSSVHVKMVDFAVLWMEAAAVALDGLGATVRKHVLLVIMAQTAHSVAIVRTVAFATGFLEAVSVPTGTMDKAVNTNVLLDFMALIVFTPVTARMEPVVI